MTILAESTKLFSILFINGQIKIKIDYEIFLLDGTIEVMDYIDGISEDEIKKVVKLYGHKLSDDLNKWLKLQNKNKHNIKDTLEMTIEIRNILKSYANND